MRYDVYDGKILKNQEINISRIYVRKWKAENKIKRIII